MHLYENQVSIKGHLSIHGSELSSWLLHGAQPWSYHHATAHWVDPRRQIATRTSPLKYKASDDHRRPKVSVAALDAWGVCCLDSAPSVRLSRHALSPCDVQAYRKTTWTTCRQWPVPCCWFLISGFYWSCSGAYLAALVYYTPSILLSFVMSFNYDKIKTL